MLENILSESDVRLWNQLVGDAEQIVLCAHTGPDGDAVGSSLGLADYLNSLGKTVHIVMPNAFPDFLRWMKGTGDILCYDKRETLSRRRLMEADLIVCLDFNAQSRVGRMEDALRASTAPKIMLDHHLGPEPFASLTVSHPELCATSEVVFRVLWQLGGYARLSVDGASALYCGMMTDTGGFTYSSNRSDIFYIIGQLLEKGIDKDKIYRNVFHTYSPDRLRLMGYVLYEKLHFFPGLRASVFTLSEAERNRFHYIKGDSEGLVNIPLSVKGLLLSIYLREDTETQAIRVSLRSVDDFPCNEMAARFFNGGGHLNASGGELKMSMEDALKQVEVAVEAYRDRLACDEKPRRREKN